MIGVTRLTDSTPLGIVTKTWWRCDALGAHKRGGRHELSRM